MILCYFNDKTRVETETYVDSGTVCVGREERFRDMQCGKANHT